MTSARPVHCVQPQKKERENRYVQHYMYHAGRYRHRPLPARREVSEKYREEHFAHHYCPVVRAGPVHRLQPPHRGKPGARGMAGSHTGRTEPGRQHRGRTHRFPTVF